MSHTVEITTKFNNWEMLEKAFDNLNWNIKEKSKIRTYPGDPGENRIYDYIAVNPGSGSYAYDVGITTKADGLISLNCDLNGSIIDALGRDFAKLKSEYAKELIRDMYQDFDVVETLENGDEILEVEI